MNIKNIEAFAKKEGLTKGEIKKLQLLLEGEGSKYKHSPVSIEAFLEDPFYLGWNRNNIYPKVKEALIEINSGKYYEAVLTGGIGVAKTTIAIYSTLFQLYLLSCLESPQEEYGLDPASEIVIIFQNINKEKAINADFKRFLSLINVSPYFKKHFQPKKETQSELIFANNIVVRPVSGAISATLGENIYGGFIDEVNFMEVVDKSKKSIDGQEYDQAESLYNSIARRRESRFLRNGKLPGLLSMASSKRCPGDFTERKTEEAKTEPGIYVYDRRIWGVKPDGTFSEEKFKVFVGSLTQEPRIVGLEEYVTTDIQGNMLEIPVDFKKEFERDIYTSLREIGGVSFRPKSSFFTNFEKVSDCIGLHRSILNFKSVDLSKHKLRIVNHVSDPWRVHWVHIDLGLTRDHAGIVMGHVPKFVKIHRGEDIFETLPFIKIDLVLDIIPPKNGEIEFSKIRELIYQLLKSGINIRGVTLDAFQSRDTIQQLRRKSVPSQVFSVDDDPKAYLLLRDTFYDKRIIIPSHDRLIEELRFLELDELKGKIDHLPKKSKDLSDSLAAVAYNLSMNGEIWYREHKEPIIEARNFVQSRMGNADLDENSNSSDLNGKKSIQDEPFSGEGIVTADEDPTIWADLGFA